MAVTNRQMVVDRRRGSRVREIHKFLLFACLWPYFGQCNIETKENSVPFFGVGKTVEWINSLLKFDIGLNVSCILDIVSQRTTV